MLEGETLGGGLWSGGLIEKVGILVELLRGRSVWFRSVGALK